MCVAGVSLQLLGRQGDDALCLHHSPVGAELAVCNSRADLQEAPGTLFLWLIQTY